MLNLNKFAKEITEVEGLKKSINIAQVKEVMKIMFKKIAKLPATELAAILTHYSK